MITNSDTIRSSCRLNRSSRQRGSPLLFLLALAVFASAAFAQSPLERIATNWPGVTIHLSNALTVWHSAPHKANRVVAIVDYGFIPGNLELQSALKWQNTEEIGGIHGVDDDMNGFVDDLHGWDFIDDDNVPSSDGSSDKHGTGVVTVIGARATGSSRFVGVAPNAELMLIRWSGEPEHRVIANLVQGIDYAVQNGAKIINFSASWQVDPEHPVVIAGVFELERALNSAADHDVLVVLSVKNYPVTNLDDPGIYPHIATMFDHPNIICVTGIRTDDSGHVSRYGQYGGTTVDIAAPAEVYGPFGSTGFETVIGASYATAIATGGASVVWGLMPRLTAAEVRSLLLGKARPLGTIIGVEWGQLPPAVPNGVLDLSFLDEAYQAYVNGLAYGGFFPANAKDRPTTP